MSKTIMFPDGPRSCTEVQVLAIGFDNSKPLSASSEGKMRTEIINLDENVLFQNAETVWDIEDKYEIFWNRLNELGSGWSPSNIVKVVRVMPLI